jgi:hypothetical protein
MKGQITIQFLVNMVVMLLLFAALLPTYYSQIASINGNASLAGDSTTPLFMNLVVPMIAIVLLAGIVVYISGSGGRQEQYQ